VKNITAEDFTRLPTVSVDNLVNKLDKEFLKAVKQAYIDRSVKI
jgi:hypothetical protein|tara:strand:- start:760 stop:891 length:132 start_codon:yes stop_codon:yes gene_type:complete